MHSSRMCTGRSLTVCCSLLPWGGCLLQGGGGSAPRGSAPGEVSAPRGGICSKRGVCSQGGCLLPEGCLLQGGCLLPEGCLLPGGCIPACTEADTLPPLVDRILDTRLWKYYLGPTSLRPVKTLAKSYLWSTCVEVAISIMGILSFPDSTTGG